MIIVIPLKCPSLNLFYAGTHWHKRKKLKDLWRGEVALVCRKMKPFTKFPLRVTTTAYFKVNRRRDADNLIVAPKMFIDSLVALNLMPDDSYKYVGEIILKSPKVGTDRVEFMIEEM